jgi:hypothetical protein
MADDKHPGATAAFVAAMVRIQERFGLSVPELIQATLNAQLAWANLMTAAECAKADGEVAARIEAMKKGLT